MNDLANEIESFKGKIESANQLIDELKLLTSHLDETAKMVNSFEKSSKEIEEKYYQINLNNDLKFQDLQNRQVDQFEIQNNKYNEEISNLQKIVKDIFDQSKQVNDRLQTELTKLDKRMISLFESSETEQSEKFSKFEKSLNQKLYIFLAAMLVFILILSFYK